MKYSNVDALLDNKSETVKDTVRPHVNVNEAIWDNFRYALEYANLNRATRLHTNVVMESFMTDFVDNIKARMVKEEGSANGFMMFLADRRLEKEMNDAKKREGMKETLKAKAEGALRGARERLEGQTLDYSDKRTVKRKKDSGAA